MRTVDGKYLNTLEREVEEEEGIFYLGGFEEATRKRFSSATHDSALDENPKKIILRRLFT